MVELRPLSIQVALQFSFLGSTAVASETSNYAENYLYGNVECEASVDADSDANTVGAPAFIDGDDTLVRNEFGGKGKCGLYLAESSYPGVGLGVYTAKDVKEGEAIGEPELFVPIIDPDKSYWQPWHDVVWSGGNFAGPGALSFDNTFVQDEFVPGLGAHANCHLGLYNVDHVPESARTDSAGTHRYRHPSAGAFTHHHGVEFVATTNIAGGSELFIDYGEDWFRDRLDDMSGVVVPTEDDYDEANRILHSVLRENDGVVTQEQWVVYRNEVENVRVKTALPEEAAFLKYASEIGTARFSLPDFVRTYNWLETNGLCIDNLKVGNSTIPQAGRGAFAKRFIPRGSLIAPAPLTIIDREDLVMYEPFEDAYGDLTFSEDEGDIVGMQLLLNYCYGHPESRVLLLPTSPVVNLINHRSGRDGSNNDLPNAEIRWSDAPYHRAEWLEKDPEEVLSKERGLMMEFVALRDLLPGEEIFVDYGAEWDDAWERHVREWSPKPEDKDYVSAADYIRRGAFEIMTDEEQTQGARPYPLNLQTACYYMQTDPHGVRKLRGVPTERMWNPEVDNYQCLLPCTVVSRQEEGGSSTSSDIKYSYTANMLNFEHFAVHNIPDFCRLPKVDRFVVSSIPADAITVVDRPYSSDQHITAAFRHEIGLPLELFPTAWKQESLTDKLAM